MAPFFFFFLFRYFLGIFKTQQQQKKGMSSPSSLLPFPSYLHLHVSLSFFSPFCPFSFSLLRPLHLATYMPLHFYDLSPSSHPSLPFALALTCLLFPPSLRLLCLFICPSPSLLTFFPLPHPFLAYVLVSPCFSSPYFRVSPHSLVYLSII